MTVRRILRDLRPYHRLLLGGFALLLVAAPASIFHPLVWRFVVDDVLMKKHIEWLLPTLLVMVAVQGLALLAGVLPFFVCE